MPYPQLYIIQNRHNVELKIGKNVQIGIDTKLAPSCKIGNNVKIGDRVTIEGDVQIGDDTTIDHGVLIRGTVKIGKGNKIFPYCIIGTNPQHKEFTDHTLTGKQIKIGNFNIIREFTVVHLPTVNKATSIGSGCYLMVNSHIGHDVILHDNITMTNLSTLGGHVEIFDYATLGFGTLVHQFCKIGSYSMIGMNNSIVKDVLPFSIINRQKFTKINKIGMKRNGVSQEEIHSIEKMYLDKVPLSPKKWYEKEVKQFIRKSKRGLYEPSFMS